MLSKLIVKLSGTHQVFRLETLFNISLDPELQRLGD